MKTKSLLIAMILLALTVSPVQAQQKSPPTLAYYDAQIRVLMPRLETFQADYHNATGKHYQALQSHTTPPSVPAEPDQLSGNPDDQADDLAYFWDNYAHLPPQIAWAFAINTYSGPAGDGYVLVVTADVDDALWTRAVNVGPEDWRTFDWTEVTE